MSVDARFLAALSEELAHGRAMAEALAPLLSAAPSADRHEAVVRAQGLDMLVQHLDALAAMTARGLSPSKEKPFPRRPIRRLRAI